MKNLFPAMLVAVLLVPAMSRAEEAPPADPPAPQEQPAALPATDAVAGEPAPMPAAADALPAPAPEAAPAAAPAPTTADEKPAEKKDEGPKRRYGALSVLGLGSMFVGVAGIILGGVTFMGPALVGTGWAPIQANADGIPLPGTGQSINPFAALGTTALVGGLLFGAAGAAMLVLEVYLNDGF
ncbi:MAG: hypothetical protein HY904_02250 [Deltaproteobacteria bacterium]|nr:hypothetical protein [Deltaproteobacteria bacterium]